MCMAIVNDVEPGLPQIRPGPKLLPPTTPPMTSTPASTETPQTRLQALETQSQCSEDPRGGHYYWSNRSDLNRSPTVGAVSTTKCPRRPLPRRPRAFLLYTGTAAVQFVSIDETVGAGAGHL